ncbi:hypothetical protein ISN45_Aa02g022150, partial [Arabidopsis thaliana x Arabidopsis arenosa]
MRLRSCVDSRTSTPKISNVYVDCNYLTFCSMCKLNLSRN